MEGGAGGAAAQEVVGGRYRVEGRLGEGSQAVVLRVRDLRDGRGLAMKRLLPAFIAKKKMRGRFEAEARTLSTLDHPNVVRVCDVAVDGPEPYFVMELVEGGSLVDRLQRDGALPPRRAVFATLQLCHGLAAAHRLGIIHRDVKPHNVLLAADGTCKLTDFGIARMGDAGLRTRAGAALGTEGFMAPEQAIDATRVDPRSDVYGVGMTLFVLLTGEDPWAWIAGHGRAKVPDALREPIERATQDAPEARHPDLAALAADLRSRLDPLPADPPDTPWGRLGDPGPLAPASELSTLPEERSRPPALGPVDLLSAPLSLGPPSRPASSDLPGPAAEAGAPTRPPPSAEGPAVPLWLATGLFLTSAACFLGVVALGLSLLAG